jgi:hypothetical protein
MLNHDAADDPRASMGSRIIDEIEPEYDFHEETPEQRDLRIEKGAYREAAKKHITFLMSMLNFLHAAKTAQELAARIWIVSSAIDHPCVEDFDSNTQIANKIGISKADYSRHLVTFQRYNNMPPSSFQKRVEARESYRKTRKNQLIQTCKTAN